MTGGAGPGLNEKLPRRGLHDRRVSARRLVILETPYRGNNHESLQENIAYARACMADCLHRYHESPLAFHLLYTQPGVTDDTIPEQRQLGMDAADAWAVQADAVVVYTDRGISGGMKAGIEKAVKRGLDVTYRTLPGYNPAG